MPKFYVQTWARVYVGGFEVEADSYHEAAIEAEHCIEPDEVEDKGEEGKLITGQYTQMIEAEVHLRDWESGYENTRFLERATRATPGGAEFAEISDLVWNDRKCTPRGDIHERIADV